MGAIDSILPRSLQNKQTRHSTGQEIFRGARYVTRPLKIYLHHSKSSVWPQLYEISLTMYDFEFLVRESQTKTHKTHTYVYEL